VLHTASEGRHQIKTSWSTQYWYLNAEWHLVLPVWQLRLSGTFISSVSPIFRPLKEALGGKTLRSDEEVQGRCMSGCVCSQKMLLQRSVKRWRICIERNQNFVEM
jgi:hypothetical protein